MNVNRIRAALVLSVVAASLGTASAFPPPVTSLLLKTIQSVSAEGKGNEAARKAVELLSASSVEKLPDILAGFDQASPLAANYLRAVVETIVDRQLADRKKLPVGQLEQVVKDAQRDPRARRLAYEVLLRVDKSTEDRIIPGMLLDSSPEFRRDAVARLIKQAEQKGLAKDEAIALNRKALSGATDEDQVTKIARSLKDLGETVNLVEHFGFLTSWKIVGPFDNRDFIGFKKTYPPEEMIDLSAKLEGQKGDVTWGDISTEHEFGIVDIAKSIAPHKGAVMYLTTEFNAKAARDVEFRFGTPNAWKLWVNGKLLFGRDEYHRGMAIDQYSVPAKLKAGRNVILLKLCQNEQEESWAQRYQIQLRICDSTGIAVKAVAANGEGQSGRKVAATGGQD